MRQIMQLRYRNGLGWGEIGNELGYHRTTVQKKHDDFFEDE
jgi:DNA-directed RNA polymerase specialized sigma subunit